MPYALNIFTLGRTAIVRDGESIDSFVTSKVPLLVIYLALNPGIHFREVLAQLLWDNMTSNLARNNLSKALTDVRKHLPGLLTTTRETITLSHEITITVDYDEFIRQSDAFQQRPQEKLSTYQALRMGECLSDIDSVFLPGAYVRNAAGFEEWMRVMQEEVLRRYRYILTLYVDHLVSRHRFQDALLFRAHMQRYDLLNEQLYRHFMIALAAIGRRNEALSLYHELERLLDSELAVKPEADTSRLADQLRDNTFKITPLAAIPTRLPYLSAIAEKHLDTLRRLTEAFDDPSRRLVTLLGEDVAGKTRLAAHYGRDYRYDYPGGVFLVSLAEVTTIRQMLSKVGKILGIETAGDDPLTLLITGLEDRRMLLILDKLDHLVDAASILPELMLRTTNLKVLVTCQKRLDLPGEYVIDLHQPD